LGRSTEGFIALLAFGLFLPAFKKKPMAVSDATRPFSPRELLDALAVQGIRGRVGLASRRLASRHFTLEALRKAVGACPSIAPKDSASIDRNNHRASEARRPNPFGNRSPTGQGRARITSKPVEPLRSSSGTLATGWAAAYGRRDPPVLQHEAHSGIVRFAWIPQFAAGIGRTGGFFALHTDEPT